MIRQTFRIVQLAVFLFVLLAGFGGNAAGYSGINNLLNALEDDSNPSSGYRIITARNNMETAGPRHTQYSRSCSFFSLATIVEYMGWSHFEAGSHYDDTFEFVRPCNPFVNGYETLDVGYFGSAEHLITQYIHNETLDNNDLNYPYGGSTEPELNFLNYPVGSDLNRNTYTPTPPSTTLKNCEHYHDFFYGNEYGFCDGSVYYPYTPRNNMDIEQWLRVIATSTGNNDPAASGLLFHFMNDVLQQTGMAGCNDARRVRPNFDTGDGIDDMRRIIKAFVDANTPLLVSVIKGRHFIVIIGYADIDDTYEGLPRSAIAVEVNYPNTMHAGKHWYRVMEGIDNINNWNQDDADSPQILFPWNQHLDGGCETGGWADNLDNSLDYSDHKICPQLPSLPLNCQDRYFGIEIQCHDNCVEKKSWFRYPESPFVAEPDNYDCDKVVLRYSDGEHEIVSAVARRYSYDHTLETWSNDSTYYPDTRAGIISSASPTNPNQTETLVTWGQNWPEDYYMVADSLSAHYTKKRTQFELTLDDNSKIYVEVAPPNTYGIKVVCSNNDPSLIGNTYFSEADVEVFDDTNYFWQLGIQSCDKLEATVSLGHVGVATGANVNRWEILTNAAVPPYWSSGPSWSPDTSVTVYDGLSGSTKKYAWDAQWPNGDYLSAKDVIESFGMYDFKTQIVFSGLNRTVWIVPH